MSQAGRFKDKFKEADKAFDGKFNKELNDLMGMSRSEIDAITPDTTDLRVYNVLLEVVKEASQKNIKKADLIKDIKELGEVAVTIAKKIPSLAKLL